MSSSKLVVYVPLSHADIVREAIGAAGAGKIGKYSFCSFSTRGVGRFKPEKGANPHIGSVGKLEAVEEERIEVTCDDALVETVVAAIKRVHPYEEVALDAYSLVDLEARALARLGDDELYEHAKEIVIESQKASTSYLQRRLGIGYSRAAHLMDVLEEKGVIGPAPKTGSSREILIR